jgi:hypothetical protein
VVVRVRSKSRPGDDSQDIDFGPHVERVERLSKIARFPIDEAIVYAASHGHRIKASR